MGRSLSDILCNKCGTLFNSLEYAQVNSIISSNGWSLPQNLLSSEPLCANLIQQVPISEGTDILLWEDMTQLNSKIICKVLFEPYSNVSWHHEVWFTNYALNYGLYCWLTIIGGLKTSDVF